MKKLEAERGITLMALIITIVVLLILSAVTIGTVKESKIIKHAQNAKEDFETIQEKELNSFQEYEDIILENAGEKVASYEDDVPIPVGFKYVDGKKDTGLVIEHRKEGSQFVWIPVKDGVLPAVQGDEPAVITENADESSKNLEMAGMPKESTLEDFKEQITNEYDAMVASVKKYNGFYVGRYEVSFNEEKAQSKPEKESATAERTSGNTWYGLYKLCKTYQTSSVKSSMIWGCQYEAVMDFIGEEAADKKIDGANKTKITGSIKTDIINNIYDLYGCHMEWTQEAYDNKGRVERGGHDQGALWPSFGHYYNYWPWMAWTASSRLALYIEL